MRKVIALASVVALVGCSTISAISSVKVSPKAVYDLQVGLHTAIATATIYTNLDPCRSGETFLKTFNCSEDATVAKLQPAEELAVEQEKKLDAFTKAHPDELGIQGVYDAARAAFDAIANVISVYHIGGK